MIPINFKPNFTNWCSEIPSSTKGFVSKYNETIMIVCLAYFICVYHNFSYKSPNLMLQLHGREQARDFLW